MNNTRKYLPYALAAATFAAGVFAGKAFFKKSPRPVSATPAATVSSSSAYPYLSPFLKHIENAGLNMKELKSFRPALARCIREAQRKHPDLHVAYYYRDLNNGMWIGLNEQEEFSPASLMKVPLMVTVLKEAQANPGYLETKILFEKEKYANIDEESGFAKEDRKFYTIGELVQQSVQYSDNAASLMLMNYVGMEKVIRTENDMNLAVDATEDFYSNFVKVKSYAGSLRIIYNAAYLNPEMSEKAMEILAGSVYQGGMRAAIPSSIKIAHKYGERDVFDKSGNRNTLQLHHFGLVYYPGKPFLLGIMTRGADRDTKEKLIRDLAKITYEEVDRQVKSEKTQMVNIDY